MALNEQLKSEHKRAIWQLIVLAVGFVIAQMVGPTLQQLYVEDVYQVDNDLESVNRQIENTLSLETQLLSKNYTAQSVEESRAASIRAELRINQQAFQTMFIDKELIDSLSLCYLNLNSAVSNFVNRTKKYETSIPTNSKEQLEYLSMEFGSYRNALYAIREHLSIARTNVVSNIQTVNLVHLLLNITMVVLLFFILQQSFLKLPKKIIEENDALGHLNKRLQGNLEKKKKRLQTSEFETKELEKDLRIVKSSLYENSKRKDSFKKDIDFLASGLEKQVARPVKAIMNLVNWTISDDVSKLSIEANKNQHLILDRSERIVEYVDLVKQYAEFNRSSGPVERVNAQLIISEMLAEEKYKSIEFVISGKPPVLTTDKASFKDVIQKIMQALVVDNKLESIQLTISERIDFAQFNFTAKYKTVDMAQAVLSNLTFKTSTNYISQLNIALIKKKVNSLNGNFSIEDSSDENLSLIFTWPYEI